MVKTEPQCPKVDLTNVIPELPRETVNLKGAGTKDQGCNEEILKARGARSGPEWRW